MLESTKKMRKLFGKDKEGLGKTLEGYLYGKWPSVFIYHIPQPCGAIHARS